ncbi:AraC family transcriptional regulator (plasmid) [Streptomyces sp. BI20]|uniref:AraC family transcriptional regulator n=1 Tax=Streptomyces sp. BI20 TaxID=3403460 RepID=UPI003C77A7EA
MDALAGLLEGPKARGAFLLKSVFDPPWSLRVEDRAPVSLVTMVRGEAWIVPDRAESVLLRPGDLAVLRGPDAYSIGDDPDTPNPITVGPDQRCGTEDGTDLTDTLCAGVRSWGGPAGEGSHVMLSGTYQQPGEVGGRLLATLPTVLVRRAGVDPSPLLGLLAREIVRDEIGQELVLDRLLDLLFVSVVREWLAEARAGVPGWHQARSDAVVGPALRLLHERPAAPWTVVALAREVGVSRSSLARRFTDLVGEPPMAYLASWRLTLAADLLREPEATVAGVARRVGYGTPFALSTAFKRVRGISPSEHREGAPSAAPARPAHPPRTVVLDD